jgi:hypothetical protein
MLDLKGHLEVFIITNGRSTYPYCLKSVNEQVGVKFKLTIIEGKAWLEANELCLAQCESKYFLRVDDDMLLHPRALHFAAGETTNRNSNEALKFWKLWQPYSGDIINGIKAYHTELTRKVKFRTNHLGKIDKPFYADLKTHNLVRKGSTSVIGVHSCSNAKEHIDYALRRGEQNGKDFKKKRARLNALISSYSGSLEDQYKILTGKLIKINHKQNSSFYKFLSENKFI